MAFVVKNDIDGKHGKLSLYTGNDEVYDDVLTKIREKLIKQGFAQQVALFPYTENVSLTKFYNWYLSTAERLANAFPAWFKINFTKLRKENVNAELVEQICGQESINAGGRKRMVMISVMKQSDGEAWKKYENAMFKYVTQIGTQLFGRGDADSEYWDDVALVSYRSRAKFCEMALSEEVHAVLPFKQKGLSDTHTYMTYQIIECSERINGCAPTDD